MPPLKTRLIDPELITAELCRRNFYEFVKRAWREVDNAPFVDNWHVKTICDHLQWLHEGKFRRLAINIPPGLGKSLFSSVLFPAWVWAKDPKRQMMYTSYAGELCIRDSIKTRALIRCDWYQKYIAQNQWTISEDVAGKTRFETSVGGARFIVTPGGQNTGWRGDYLVYDDPLKAGDAHSKIERDNSIRFKTETMANRYNDQATFRELVIMQRLHQEDLTGFLLESTEHLPHTDPGRWQFLILPVEFEPDRRCVTYDLEGNELWRDPRVEEGELLFPQRLPQHELDRLKSPQGLGSYAYAGQYQQRPVPAGGGMIKREWFKRFWTEEPDGEEYLIAVDATFKKTEDSDRVAVGVWCRKGPDAYLLDMAWDRMGFMDTVRAIKRLKESWPQVSKVLVEDKANGSAIIEVLKQEIPGVIPVQPEGGKEARISSVTGYFEGGNVILPKHARWTQAFIDEACTFPKGKHDDGIDMAAYALKRLLVSSKLVKLRMLVNGASRTK